ncbi:hypothetical protein CEXT_175231 [Caerostris extrusa]|uniref:Uncharacterized protein n=1 Tax=Caerostris extrusa TaxID=172846 RepID=A0AAV4XMB1_CAEEX|nr:hypothetical protein CEXT_175231 [Caerostris extrusa]
MNWNIISVVFCNIFGSRQSDFAFYCEDLSYVQVPTCSKVKKLLIYTIAMEENDEKRELTDDQPSQLNVQQMDNTGEEDNGAFSQHENKDCHPEKAIQKFVRRTIGFCTKPRPAQKMSSAYV